MIVKRAAIKWLSPEEGGRKSLPPGPQYIAPAKFLAHEETWDAEVWSLVVDKVEELGSPGQWLADVHFWAESGPHGWLEPVADPSAGDAPASPVLAAVEG